jgi:hypothetical protein
VTPAAPNIRMNPRREISFVKFIRLSFASG